MYSEKRIGPRLEPVSCQRDKWMMVQMKQSQCAQFVSGLCDKMSEVYHHSFQSYFFILFFILFDSIKFCV